MNIKFAITITALAVLAGFTTSACVSRAEAAEVEQELEADRPVEAGDAKDFCCEGVPGGLFCHSMDPMDPACEGDLVPLADVCREHL